MSLWELKPLAKTGDEVSAKSWYLGKTVAHSGTE
jgi:hypothetical protein